MATLSIGSVGCCVLDILYPDADLSSPAFAECRSRKPGDGGLVPGGLVFADELQRFAGQTPEEIARAVSRGAPVATNLGGPAATAPVHAAQVLAQEGVTAHFYGYRGDDSNGDRLADLLGQTPLDCSGVKVVPGRTPSTVVLSDPAAEGGGERSFINTIGVAARFGAGDVPEDFFRHQITFFGGTALVPSLHRDLGVVLRTARANGSLTVVGPVYDFLNEKRNPNGLWPMGNGQADYEAIDLIICDREEARRLTGCERLPESLRRFVAWGAGAAIITDGASPVHFVARGGSFHRCPPLELPPSAEVARRASTVAETERDTTGCGDNLAGGVLASMARQLARGPEDRIDLRHAVIEGVAAGAAAWFFLGSTWIESEPGEKAAMVEEFRSAYLRQIGEGE